MVREIVLNAYCHYFGNEISPFLCMSLFREESAKPLALTNPEMTRVSSAPLMRIPLAST